MGTRNNIPALQPLHRIVPWYSVDISGNLMSDRQIQTRPKKAGFFMGLSFNGGLNFAQSITAIR